jgi:hypothetical protein
MKPIQNVLGFRVDELGQITDVLSAVGQESDLLIHSHILAFQQLE